ncbi:hypothetical protein [Devosia ginsengisoli]|uniref:Uncharacterized protein n=1 Tax=Devosia ginsengisoli TaxID=400770 RepID=A0A5B8LS29_9HYPH|nr:hypothetical protein [Devosia ginsengisoli]QDZ10545.1 hypothetical protein FPZ08_07145 [Devosia ginsengisoli]
MTSRKSAQPVEVAAPAIPADESFGNAINAQRDAAIVEEQVLASRKAALVGQFERDLARLHAGFDVSIASLDDQLNRQVNIITAADAALMALTEARKTSNIVAMAAE